MHWDHSAALCTSCSQALRCLLAAEHCARWMVQLGCPYGHRDAFRPGSDLTACHHLPLAAWPQPAPVPWPWLRSPTVSGQLPWSESPFSGKLTLEPILPDNPNLLWRLRLSWHAAEQKWHESVSEANLAGASPLPTILTGQSGLRAYPPWAVPYLPQ